MSEQDNEWKKLYKEQIEKTKAIEKRLEETLKLLEAQNTKNEDLEVLLKRYKKYVPKEKLKPRYSTEEEKTISIIQRSCRRNIQSRNLLNLVQQSKNSELSSRLKERNNIIKEILKTESDYVNSINQITSLYLNPLKDHKKKIISEKDIKTIFTNIEVIISTHSIFLISLKNRLLFYPVKNLGGTFLEKIPTLVVHITYCNKFNESMEKIKDLLKTNPEFEKFLNETRKETQGGLDLKSLLIQPIQRLPRYSLLLRDLIEQTNEKHVDYADLVTAKNKLDKIVETINENKKKYETANTMLRLNEFTADLQSIIKLDIRNFVIEDISSIKVISKEMKTQKDVSKRFILFLFSDVLVTFECTKKEKGIWAKVNKQIGNNSSSKKVTHFDEKYDEYIVYYNHYYLNDCTIVSFDSHTKEIGIECLPSGQQDPILIFLSIEDDKRGNKREVWHRELTKFIASAKIKNMFENRK
eukprot:gene3086-5256_t